MILYWESYVIADASVDPMRTPSPHDTSLLSYMSWEQLTALVPPLRKRRAVNSAHETIVSVLILGGFTIRRCVLWTPACTALTEVMVRT